MKKLLMIHKMKKIVPDIETVLKRYEYFWRGEILDRPLLIYQTGKKDFPYKQGDTYHDRCFGNIDTILDNYLFNIRNTLYYGDAYPNYWISLGTHEIAAYMGGEIKWAEGGGDTNWAVPKEGDFDDIFPIRIDKNNKLFKRLIELYGRAVEKFDGESFIFAPDFHTNMDLLLSLRGDEQLCFDCVDSPEKIDRAMPQVQKVFTDLFNAAEKAGRFDEYGYAFNLFSSKTYTCLACDFAALVSEEMFRRWIMPALEYECGRLERARFHWDGPGALRHFEDIMSIGKICNISFVPNPFESHLKYLELYEKIQARGKSIEFGGNFDEIKLAAKVLKPNLTVYSLRGDYGPAEFEEIEKFLRKQ